MEVEINVKIISYQALDHRDARGRKGRDLRRGRNIPAKTLSISFVIDIFHSFCVFHEYNGT